MVKQRLVLYHGNCFDGITAAWAVWRKFGYTDTEYMAVHHGSKTIPNNLVGRDIVIVDFAYDRDDLVRMHAEAASLIVLDHHLTAQDALEGLDYCVFDMNRSGAGIAWDYYHGIMTPRPWLVDYVEDRDLWNWALPDTHNVCAGMLLADLTIEDIDKLANRDIDVVMQDGVVASRVTHLQVESACKQASMKTIAGYSDVPTVNSCLFQSQIGNRLLQLYPDAPFSAIYAFAQGQMRWSLRSADGRVDVAQLAKSLGGGGHRNSAGFMVKPRVDVAELIRQH